LEALGETLDGFELQQFDSRAQPALLSNQLDGELDAICRPRLEPAIGEHRPPTG